MPLSGRSDKRAFDDLGGLSLKNASNAKSGPSGYVGARQIGVRKRLRKCQSHRRLHRRCHCRYPTSPQSRCWRFQNMSGDPEQEYFADGIAEDIITELSRFKYSVPSSPAIRKVSPTKGRPVDVKQVGRELGVRYVPEGSVRRSGPRVRVSAQLIDAFSGEHIWSTNAMTRQQGDIFAVQDELRLCCKIVAVLPGRVESAEQALCCGRRTSQSLEAHDLLLRAKFLHHFVSPDANLEAEECLDRAIEKDPTFCGGTGLEGLHDGSGLGSRISASRS